MDRSRHNVTKFLNDEKTHIEINNKLFKRLNFITDHFPEVEVVKSEIEHRELIIVGFFILQYAQLRMLALHYNLFEKYCVPKIYGELEMDTESLYLALSEENLADIILPEKRKYVCEIVHIDSLRMQQATSSQENVVLLKRSKIRESRDYLKKNSGVPKCCACAAKPIVATIKRVTNTNSVAWN